MPIQIDFLGFFPFCKVILCFVPNVASVEMQWTCLKPEVWVASRLTKQAKTQDHVFKAHIYLVD